MPDGRRAEAGSDLESAAESLDRASVIPDLTNHGVTLEEFEAIRAILECLGLPSRAPPVAPAAAEPELDEIDLDSSSN